MRRIALFLPVAFLLLLGGCFEREKPSVADKPRPVQAVAVHLTPSLDTRDYAGLIRPRHEADIAFRAGGRIIERRVDMGARVHAGDVLARLDPADLDLAARSARADLASATAQEAQATAEAARYGALVRLGHVSASDDDARQAAARTAHERVTSAQAALQLAENRRRYADLAAPEDGVVTAILADPGTVVAEGAPVMRMADLDAPEAEIAVPETAVAGLADAHATVTLWAKPDLALRAQLREVAPQAAGGLRTYAARFTLIDPPPWVSLGMSATVRLAATADAAPVAELPAAAIIDRGEGAAVWAVDPDARRLALAPVRVAAQRQDRVYVSGLSEGTLVVSAGVQKLDPGVPVGAVAMRPAQE